MSTDAVLIVVLFIAAAMLLIVWLFRRSSARPDATAEFSFLTPQEANHQQFVYQVAGLIKAATGLQTHIVALGKYEGLDIEVHRGMRCVGVVSVMRPHSDSAADRLRAIAQTRDEKGVKTAYLVSGGLFTDDIRQRGKRAGVTLLDGTALKRIEANTRAGRYIKRQEVPPSLTEAESRRWRRPQVAPVHPAAKMNPDLPQEAREPKAPWVEYR